MTSRPISDYAILSDWHSAALVSGSGSVDWLCVPRFDAPSIFAELLDPGGGCWSIRPAGEYDVDRSYRPGTLVLSTRFTTPTAVLTVSDALVLDPAQAGHGLGRLAPHVLVRVVSADHGTTDLEVEFGPRPEYARVRPRLRVVPGGIAAVGGGCGLALSGPPPTEVSTGWARWRHTLRAGETIAFALHYADGWADLPRLWSQGEIERCLADTVLSWETWSAAHSSYAGPWPELVGVSARVLRGLTYADTSATVAAATTSLPPSRSSAANWDYRYSWVRDAAQTLDALSAEGCSIYAERLLGWLLGVAGTSEGPGLGTQAVYGVGGELDVFERELGHLAGWRGNGSVRVGNAGTGIGQPATCGEVLDAVCRLAGQLEPFDLETCELLATLADGAALRWADPDHGRWDDRGPPRHYLYSKLMSWVALDRAIRLAASIGRPDRVPDWTATRGQIRAEILERGWSHRLGAYAQALDSDVLDASALLLTLTGFLPVTDPRMWATIERVATDLSAPCGLLYRFEQAAATGRLEPTFLLCSYWLVQCLALAGQTARARDLFERATAYANDVGLLSEAADPLTGDLLGNFPQAMSHVGLINAAVGIAAAEGVLL